MDDSLASEQTRTEIRRAPPPRRPSRTFQALAYPDYRLLWLGQVGSSASQWMDQVVRPILVLELTGSAVQLGLVSALRMAPMLAVGLVAGAVADRFDRRRILVLAQATTMAVFFIIAFLVLSDGIAMWQVYITTLAMGTANAFNQPARQALIPSIVPREHLANAVALNSVAFNITRVVGASLAGILILPLGIGGVYFLSGVLMLVVTMLTSLISVRWQVGPAALPPFWRSLGEGLAYAGRERAVLAIVVLTLVIFVFSMPFQSVFIPLLARDELGIGDSGVGFLIAVTGAGALLGALVLASLGRLHRRGILMVAGSGALGLALAGFAISSWLPWLVLPFLLVALVGALQMALMPISNSFLLETTPPALHGRVMSLLSLDRGFITLGAVIAGFLAAAAGPQWGLIIMGALGAGSAALVAVLFPLMRRVD
ncbi:MAG: MFS transporter [Dehalococcoidia bacterium]